MTDPREVLAEVIGLSVDFHTRYGVVHAVRDVSWRVDRGETLAILGESGSGKSVTANAFMNLIDSPPGFIRSGSIRFLGQDLLKLSDEQRRQINGRKIGMVFQDPLAALNPVYTVGRQVAETFRYHGIAGDEAGRRTLELLKRVGIPDPERRAHDYPHQFSGGQRQRVVIAMAIALRPDLLIADEPTSALDVTVQAQILGLIKELQAEVGMGLVIITHDIGVVARMADRIAVMKDGTVVETGTAAAVLDAPQHPYTRRLLESTPGRHPASPIEGPGVPILDVRGVSKDYPVVTGLMRRETGQVVRALDGVSLTVHAGETVGVVGESGSGKSTLARTILRLETPTAGSVSYRGADLLALDASGLKSLRRKVQVVFQDPTASLNPRMTVERIISEPWEIHPDILPRSQWKPRTADLLEQVGLHPDYALRYPHQFSGGQRQRIAIARALALRPELIICDEAVSALDVSVQAQVIALLKRLQREYGLAYIFIAHDLAVVRDIATRVVVMHRGRIVEEGDTAVVFDRPRAPYTRELIASSLVTRLPVSLEETPSLVPVET